AHLDAIKVFQDEEFFTSIRCSDFTYVAPMIFSLPFNLLFRWIRSSKLQALRYPILSATTDLPRPPNLSAWAREQK
ncbi:hypothetical protein BGZ94_007769, partial [Podila epigama]